MAHQGCVNRVRAMTQQSHVVATWADTGYVQVLLLTSSNRRLIPEVDMLLMFLDSIFWLVLRFLHSTYSFSSVSKRVTCHLLMLSILQVWDMGAHIRSMATSGPDAPGQPSTVRQAPLQIFTGHKDEGYALDWSPITAGRLLSGGLTCLLQNHFIPCTLDINVVFFLFFCKCDFCFVF